MSGMLLRFIFLKIRFEFAFVMYAIVVFLRLPLTPAGFAKGFAFCKTRRCTKSRRASYVAKPAGDVTEARRDFVTSVRGLAMVALLARKFDRCTNFQFCRNVQSKPFPATVAKPLLGAYPFCSSVSRALDWWLFCIFCLALCGWKNANVLPKALGYSAVCNFPAYVPYGLPE